MVLTHEKIPEEGALKKTKSKSPNYYLLMLILVSAIQDRGRFFVRKNFARNRNFFRVNFRRYFVGQSTSPVRWPRAAGGISAAH